MQEIAGEQMVAGNTNGNAELSLTKEGRFWWINKHRPASGILACIIIVYMIYYFKRSKKEKNPKLDVNMMKEEKAKLDFKMILNCCLLLTILSMFMNTKEAAYRRTYDMDSALITFLYIFFPSVIVLRYLFGLKQYEVHIVVGSLILFPLYAWSIDHFRKSAKRLSQKYQPHQSSKKP